MVDHYVKEKMRVKCYMRYCDDSMGMAKTKAQAKRDMMEFDRISSELGIVVKHNAVVAPVGREIINGRKKNRKRKRSKRKNNRLFGLPIHGTEGDDEKVYKEKVCQKV